MMVDNVRHITHRTDAVRISATAEHIRVADCVDAAAYADLLAAIAQAMRTVGRPPLGEDEMFRWSAVVMLARRAADQWVPR